MKVGVLDIGKTNAKVAVVDLATHAEIDLRTHPNTWRPGPPYPHADTEALWRFALSAFAELHAAHCLDALSVTTHGASAALLARDGSLAAPVLDYEHPLPETGYDALRPPFETTGSPRLPLGLNLGAQLHWQLTLPGIRDRVAQVVTYPQYWHHRLTGVAATEATSLGCHTDLWEPTTGRLSPLAAALGLEHRIAPLRPATATAPLRPEIAAATGLAPETPVACGIHDSNASLYPHLIARPAPFAVVSTGTWVVSMAVGGAAPRLDPARDTLVNVDARGAPVLSARFMGGREAALALGGPPLPTTPDDIRAVLAQGAHLLPSLAPGTGPFPDRAAAWTVPPERLSPGERAATVAHYLAAMTATCLGLIGAQGPTIVEGPLASDGAFLDMLAAATGRDVATSPTATGTSLGAALLLGGPPPTAAAPRPAPENATALAAHAAAWAAHLG